METSSTRNDNSSERTTPTRAVATLLGVYAALYLAIVGAIHFATSPDAAAAVGPQGAGEPGAMIAVPAEPSADTNGVAATVPTVADDPDNPRECNEGIETSCIYN